MVRHIKRAFLALGLTALVATVLPAVTAAPAQAAGGYYVNTYLHHNYEGGRIQANTLNYGTCDYVGYSFGYVKGAEQASSNASSVYFATSFLDTNRCNYLAVTNINGATWGKCIQRGQNMGIRYFGEDYNDRVDRVRVKRVDSCPRY